MDHTKRKDIHAVPEKQQQQDVDFESTKFYCLILFLILLALLCIATLVGLVCMFVVLDVSSSGMSSVSFFKDHQHIKWLLDADLDNVILDDSTVGGYVDQNIYIDGLDQPLEVVVENYMKSSIQLSTEGTVINTQKFRFTSPESKKTILNINSGDKVSVVGEFSGKTIKTEGLKTPRIVSDNMDDLTFTSSAKINLIGNEGFYLDSRSVNFLAEEDINLKVKDQRYVLELGGVGLNYTLLADTRKGGGEVPTAKKYRLCVCLKTGELFRAEVTQNSLTCAIAKVNPC